MCGGVRLWAKTVKGFVARRAHGSNVEVASERAPSTYVDTGFLGLQPFTGRPVVGSRWWSVTWQVNQAIACQRRHRRSTHSTRESVKEFFRATKVGGRSRSFRPAEVRDGRSLNYFLQIVSRVMFDRVESPQAPSFTGLKGKPRRDFRARRIASSLLPGL